MSVEKNENERYARADVQGGYLYNKSEIDYFKQTQAVDVMYNLMLGDFNQKGAYVINKGVIDQLVKIKKVYQYSFGSTTFCQSAQDIGGYGKIDFAIKMRNNTQNKTITATLQLLETIDRANGYYQNTNTASISVYTAPESNHYIVDMLKFFNVVSKKEEGMLHKEKNEEDVDLIIARKRYEELLKNGILDKLDSINKTLFEKRIKLLQKSEVGKKILAKFNSESYKINGWFLKEGMPGYYRYLNQVLDGLLEVHSAEVLQDVALTAGLRKVAEAAGLDIARAMNVTGKMLYNNTNEMENATIAKEHAEAMQNKGAETNEVKQPEPQRANTSQEKVAKANLNQPTLVEGVDLGLEEGNTNTNMNANTVPQISPKTTENIKEKNQRANDFYEEMNNSKPVVFTENTNDNTKDFNL